MIRSHVNKCGRVEKRDGDYRAVGWVFGYRTYAEAAKATNQVFESRTRLLGYSREELADMALLPRVFEERPRLPWQLFISYTFTSPD